MAELKKIVFIITDLDFGGAERILFELCRGLKEKFQIQVLTLKGKGHFAQRIEELGILVKTYDLKNQTGAQYFLRLFLVFLRAVYDLRKLKPDLVQGILFQGNLVAKIAGKLARAKIILCALHTFDQGRLKGLVEKLTSRLAKRYLVVSEVLKSFAQEKFSLPEEKLVVIRNGISRPLLTMDEPLLRQKLKIKPEARILGAIGRLHWEKGMDLLIRAFHHLTSEFPEMDLVLIGDGPEKLSLQQLAESLGVKARVHFVGFQPEPEKFLALFNLFVLPSRIEAMPLSLLQAMALGKAIVATRVGGIPELLEDGQQGLLVPPEDEFMLTRAISRLLRDPVLAQKLGENARSKAEREFSLEKMIADYEKLYLELLGEKS